MSGSGRLAAVLASASRALISKPNWAMLPSVVQGAAGLLRAAVVTHEQSITAHLSPLPRPVPQLPNVRLVSSAASSLDVDQLIITDAAVQRLQELAKDDASKPCLRVSVVAGGCSGFQYNFQLVEKPEADDRAFSRDGVTVVTDAVSLSLIKGSKIDFEEDLIRSAFHVIDNPAAESACGCGSSFAPAM